MKHGRTDGGLRRSFTVAVIALTIGLGPSISSASAEEETPSESGGTPSGQVEGEGAATKADVEAAKAATKALFKARTRYARAVADHAVSLRQAKQMERRAVRAEKAARLARRDMGNMVRLAYTSGDSTLNLVASLMGADSPSELIGRATSAERVSAHQSVEVKVAEKALKKAQRLRKEADQFLAEAVAELSLARADLEQTKKLAKSLELETKFQISGRPVDFKTKSKWVFPVPGAKIGSEAGMRSHPILGSVRCHAGADMAAPTGTAIHAVDKGVVTQVGPNGGYGNFTVVAHGGGLTTAYAHQSAMLVEVGDRVSRGQIIGAVGNTGLSTGAHLHFEARYFGDPYDPRGWLENKPKLRVPVC
ncbi:MAG: peptidoglycan DD-metalloendopeptidase family protein [Pseudomonadota bacterium]|nr:peptidoglycan DD-metalloendopeptidase family protein [Pseudomonadota bacterium]